MISYLKKLMPQVLPVLLFLLPIATLLFVFRDVLFFGKFFFNGDVILQALPYLTYRGIGGALIAQQMLSGFPLFVTVNASWFYPISTFLFSHLPAVNAYVLLDVGNIALAYVFAYLYARKIHLGVAASALAGMVYVFSGQLMLWSPSIIMTAYYFILPACLYFFEVSLDKRPFVRAGVFVLSGLLLGSGWLSSNVQFVVYIHVFYAVYVLVRLGIRQWGAMLTALGVPFIVSFFVGLPMISAVLSFQSETLRASGVSLAQSAGLGFMPWSFVHYLLPFLDFSFFPMSLPELYVGILPFFLVLIGIFSYRERANIYTTFYMWVLAFCLLASIRYSPLAIALHYLPLWNSFRETSRLMFIGGFASAMLAGITLDYLIAHWDEIDLSELRVVRWSKALLLYVCLPVFFIFSFVRFFFFDAIKARLDQYFLSHVYATTTGLPKEHYLTIVGNYLHQALDQFSVFDPQAIFFLLFATLSLALLIFQKRFRAEHFAVLVVVLVALNFAFVYGQYHPTVRAGAITEVPQTVQAITSKEQGSRSPYRVYSIFPAMTVYNDLSACPLSPEETVALQNELLQPNSTLYFGIDSVEGYENYMPARVSDALNYIGSESTGASNPLFLERIPLGQKLGKILSRKNVLRAMNVKYIASGVPLKDSDLSPLNSWQVGHCKNPVYLYELHGVWPRYFTSSSMHSADTLDALNQMQLRGATEVFPTYGEDTMTFVPSCSSPCTFFIGNTFLDGWSATVDKKPVTISRENYLYMALTLDSGAHEVVLTYH